MADDQTQNQVTTDTSTSGGDAPVPAWLVKAQNASVDVTVPQTVEPVVENVPVPPADSLPADVPAVQIPPAEPVVAAEIIAEPVQEEVPSVSDVTPENGEAPLVVPEKKESVEDLTNKQLPAWLRVAQSNAPGAGQTVLPKEENLPVKEAEVAVQNTAEVPAIDAVQSPAPPANGALMSPKVDMMPTGLLESKTEVAPASVAQTALISPVTEPVSEQIPEVQPVGQTQTPVTSSANAQPVAETASKTNAQKKKDLFESAKNFFVASASKAQGVVEKGRTAGVPKAPKPEETTAESGTPIAAGLPESGTQVAGKPAGAADKKPSVKETAEERQKLIESEKIYQQGLATIRDLIAPSSMEIRYDSLRIEGMYAQSFYVYAYPRYLDVNWLSPIVNFDVTMDISQFIYPIDSSQIMKVLKKKVTQMQSSVRMKQEKGMVSDPALDTALQDAEELRVQIQRGQEKFFQFALYFTIYSPEEKKLEKIAKHLESLLGGKLILTKKAELQMEHAFNSTLPLCLDELEIASNMNTSPLSTTFPFSSADLTSDEGILYGLNRHNDSLIIFDRFSLENANSVVFAKSGAGKSYAVKLEILRAMMVGTDVIVIDPENEYEALSQTVGGAYLRVSLTSDRRINPFDLPRPLEGEETQPGDLLRSNIINLNGLLKIMLGGTTPEEEAMLDKALIDVYALKGITMELPDPSKIAPPTMEDLQQILSTMEGANSMSQRLEKFTSGTYSGIFNKPTNVDLQSGLMVFSIRDLEDALRPIAMYIILNYIWSRVRSELKKRILVIDEAWTMMQYEDSAKFLFGLVKRARKYFLGITTITQDVEDFIKSSYGKPVVTNSSMQLLLKQAPAAIDILAKIFNLTEGEKYMLLNSGVGQGLFFAGLKHVAIQIIASYTEDKIVTTNPEQILKSREDADMYEQAAPVAQQPAVEQTVPADQIQSA